MRTRAKEIFWNAMLLTVASLFMRTVGVTFQVVVSGRVGAEAMGLFSILSGVYGFALTLATSGIHLGVTRMTVEAMESGNRARVGGILRRATAYALFFGTLSSVLLLLVEGCTDDLFVAIVGNHAPLDCPLLRVGRIFFGNAPSLEECHCAGV